MTAIIRIENKEIVGDQTSQVIVDGTPHDITDFSPAPGYTGTWALALLVEQAGQWVVGGAVVGASPDAGTGGDRLYWYWDSVTPWTEDFCLSAVDTGAWGGTYTSEIFESSSSLSHESGVTTDHLQDHYDNHTATFCIQWHAPGATVPAGQTNEAGMVGRKSDKTVWWRGQSSAYDVNNRLYFVQSGATIPSRNQWYKAEDDLLS